MGYLKIKNCIKIGLGFVLGLFMLSHYTNDDSLYF